MNDNIKIFLIVMAIMIPLSIPIGIFAQFLADVIASELNLKEASGQILRASDSDKIIIRTNTTYYDETGKPLGSKIFTRTSPSNLVNLSHLKPNGEYDCGERSSDLAVETARLICENQHYNITGKNKTIINGYKTYCCPSPWIPDSDHDLERLHPNGDNTFPTWNDTDGDPSANGIDDFITPKGVNDTKGISSELTEFDLNGVNSIGGH